MTRTPPPILPEPCSPKLYPLQDHVERIIFIVTLFAASFLIVGEPILYLIQKRTGEHKSYTTIIDSVMHNLEYLLDTIAHPVSYLRLWALALAHE